MDSGCSVLEICKRKTEKCDCQELPVLILGHFNGSTAVHGPKIGPCGDLVAHPAPAEVSKRVYQ